jgi:hypothetical protein
VDEAMERGRIMKNLYRGDAVAKSQNRKLPLSIARTTFPLSGSAGDGERVGE